MRLRSLVETRRVRPFVAAGCFVCVIGVALLVDFHKCRGQDAVTAAKEPPGDTKAGLRRDLYFVPTVQWLPEPQIDIPGARADTEAAMRAYTEKIPRSKVTFEMLPIRGGTFLMGSSGTTCCWATMTGHGKCFGSEATHCNAGRRTEHRERFGRNELWEP